MAHVRSNNALRDDKSLLPYLQLVIYRTFDTERKKERIQQQLKRFNYLTMPSLSPNEARAYKYTHVSVTCATSM